MSIIVIYLAYLTIGAGFTLAAGRALARYGRLVLLGALGGDESTALGVSRIYVTAFYLLALGFVALTMRVTGEVGTLRQALQLLAVKIGLVLLLLGALYLASLMLLARLRRRLGPPAAGAPARRARAATPDRTALAGTAGLAWASGPAGAAGPAEAAGPAGTAGPVRAAGLAGTAGLWRPASRRAAR